MKTIGRNLGEFLIFELCNRFFKKEANGEFWMLSEISTLAPPNSSWVMFSGDVCSVLQRPTGSKDIQYLTVFIQDDKTNRVIVTEYSDGAPKYSIFFAQTKDSIENHVLVYNQDVSTFEIKSLLDKILQGQRETQIAPTEYEEDFLTDFPSKLLSQIGDGFLAVHNLNIQN